MGNIGGPLFARYGGMKSLHDGQCVGRGVIRSRDIIRSRDMRNGRVFIDGALVGPGEARISVFDRGFLYGDQVFETLRVYDGVPFALKAHLDRLDGSAERIGLVLPWKGGHIEEAARRTLAAAGLEQATMRIMVTRGGGPMVHDPTQAEDPALIVLVLELPALPAEIYSHGLTASLVAAPQMAAGTLVDPGAKTGNYLRNVLAAGQARRRGAREAIMLASDGRVAEASAANVFARIDGIWCTPTIDTGILPGITRKTILRCCAEASIEAVERPLWPDDLARADELFLCASVREVVPIVELDSRPVGEGIVGPQTRRITQLYRAEVRRYIGTQALTSGE